MPSERTVKILDMTATDMEEIMAIEATAFLSPWTRSMFIEEMHSGISQNLVARMEGQLVGYLTFWIVVDEVHILHIAVRHDVRRGGVASLLMAEMIERACRKGAVSATLEVRRSNCGARNFYERFGFTVKGTRPHYYTDASEDALIMWAVIGSKETGYERNHPAPAGEGRP